MRYMIDRAQTLDAFLAALCTGRTVFALQKSPAGYRLVNAAAWEAGRHVVGDFRPCEPLKSLVFRPREAFGALLEDSKAPAMGKRIVIGAKNCDISALRIHDFVFLQNEPADPYYKEARDNTLLVSADCANPCDVCFCTAVGEQPYPNKGFDINLSVLSQGCLIETGSAQGDAAVAAIPKMLGPASDALVKERDAQREAVTKRVADQAARKGLKSGMDFRKAVKATGENALWEAFARDCVECGACNFTCCTCHCFLLADGFDAQKKASRIRNWDACLYLNFARVAGGANPRKHRAERLYNRFEKKFVFFPEVLKTYACDGCGRCAEACTGKIDIRDVLKKAVDAAESV